MRVRKVGSTEKDEEAGVQGNINGKQVSVYFLTAGDDADGAEDRPNSTSPPSREATSTPDLAAAAAKERQHSGPHTTTSKGGKLPDAGLEKAEDVKTRTPARDP